MLDDYFFSKLRERILSFFESGGSHAFDHTQRVYNLAIKIGEIEKADLDILRASALLHDISRLKEDNKEVDCHAEHGAKTAEKILKEMNFPKEKIDDVVYSIKVHRHSKGIIPDTKEARILQDADRLDALGAITIARMFSTGGKLNKPLYNPNIPFGKIFKGYKSESTIHGFHAKILKITPESFNTSFASKLAEKRYKFVKDYLGQFLEEWNGVS